MIYSTELANRLPKSKRIRRSMIPLVIIYVRYSDQARRHGMFSLEEFHREMTETILNREITSIFHRSLEWVIDGYSEELITQNLYALLNSRRWSSKELLALILIAEGVCSLHRGENPRIIEQQLLSWMGFDIFDFYEKEREKAEQISERLRMNRLDRFKVELLQVQNDRVKEAGFIDRVFESMNVQDLLRLLKEIDSYDLYWALTSCRKETIEFILSGLSERTGYDLLDSIYRKFDEYGVAIAEPSPDDSEETTVRRANLQQKFEKWRHNFSITLASELGTLLNDGEIKVLAYNENGMKEEIQRVSQLSKIDSKKESAHLTEDEISALLSASEGGQS